MTPRRFGKTWAVAMFVIATLIAVPGIKIAIFSTGTRASTSVLKQACAFLENLGNEYNRRVVKNNNEHLFIADTPLPPGVTARSDFAMRMQYSETTSKLYSYPGTVVGKSRVCVCVRRVPRARR